MEFIAAIIIALVVSITLFDCQNDLDLKRPITEKKLKDCIKLCLPNTMSAYEPCVCDLTKEVRYED